MQRSLRDEARLVKSTKAGLPKVVRRKPYPSDGNDGDIVLGNTSNGIKLFAKIGNKWYTFSSDEQTLDVLEDNISASNRDKYTITNLAERREYNANSTNVSQLADALGTLIRDLKRLGFLKSDIS
tara:strand:+ start:2287 stop:2661 length:375 start_codon:yes stop_codon:yes gene_type:complete